MTQQKQNNTDAISPSLEAKLRRFAGDLTAKEAAQLHAAQPDDLIGMMSLPLGERAQQAAATLTSDEETELRDLLQRAGVATIGSDDEADVAGSMVPLYDGEDGFKGPLGTNPAYTQASGGGNLQKVGVGFLVFVATVMGPTMLINDPSTRTQGRYLP